MIRERRIPDPCPSCKYSNQACAYWIGGQKVDDACTDKKMQLRAERRIPESRIALNPVVVDDSKRGGSIGRESHHFLCTNGDCMSEVTLTLTEESYKRRFYFSNIMQCPVCARDMYQVD